VDIVHRQKMRQRAALVPPYLADRMNEMRLACAVLDAIDRYSLATKRLVTLPLIREALQTLEIGAAGTDSAPL
jgi:hypothetical protein